MIADRAEFDICLPLVDTCRVKIVREEQLIHCGKFAESTAWQRTRKKLHAAIKAVEWPPNSGKFTIYAESGKKRGEGNGVKPIKEGLMLDLKKQGWELEQIVQFGGARNPGKFDALLNTEYGPAVLEWETGLEPYLELWRATPCKHGGVLEIVVIEHDATSTDVPRITKMTDGRALA